VWTARSGYFLEEDDGELVLYQGRRGGLWFIDPTRVEATGVQVEDLRGSDLEIVEKTSWPDREDVDEYVEQLRDYADQGKPTTTTTTTAVTTTTAADPGAATTTIAGP
jgi:hypothetical protein